MWHFIVILWWLGVAGSFLATAAISALTLASPHVAAGERAGTLVGLWLRWFVGLVGAVVALVVLGLVLAALGVPVPGIATSTR